MEKTLRQKITEGALGLAFAGMVAVGSFGCTAGVFPKKHIHNYPLLKGFDFQTRNQSKKPYLLERAVIYGEQYYAQETDKTPETLPFVFFPFDKVTREIDLDYNRIKLNSIEKYVPKKVKRRNGGFRDEVKIKAEKDSETGIPGIKANILCIQQLRERAGVPENSYGFSAITTEEDASFSIRTMKILGTEYFFPHVSAQKSKEKEKLPFYLIPVKKSPTNGKAKIKIRDSNGHISIFNRNNIYRPELFKYKPKKVKPKPKKVKNKITKDRIKAKSPGQTID